MTVTIVSIAVVALIGGLLTTASASTTHRNFANADSALRSFAEVAKYSIETAPSNGASSSALFQPCATPASYLVAGDPYPRSGPAGTTVTAFGLGFASNAGAMLGTTPASSLRFVGGTSGAVSIFTIPNGLAPGSYTVYPFGGSQASPTQFTVTAAGTAVGASQFANYYSLNTTMQYWTGSAWSNNCTVGSASNLQQLTFSLSDSQPNNGGQDQVNVVIGNYKSLANPTVTTSLPMGEASTQGLGANVTFNATVAAATGYPRPTGTISWSFPTGTPNGIQNCPAYNIPNNGAILAACTVSGANAGTFTPVATYGGDLVNGPSEGNQTSINVNPAQGTYLAVSVNPAGTPSGPVGGSTIQYTATINPQGGVVPTGTVTWTPPTGTNCAEPATQTLPPSPGPYSVTCTINNAPVGAQTAKAMFNGDTACASGTTNCNYPAQGPISKSVTVLNATSVTVQASSALSGNNTNVTFTATVNTANALSHGDQITWTGVPTGATCQSPATLPNTAPYTSTCVINNVPAGTTYTPVAAFGGDATHATSSGSTSYTVPTVSWTSSLVVNGHGVNAVNVLTITATLGGGSSIATGNVTMSTTGAPGVPLCSTSLNNSGQASCTITGVSASSNYTATITYVGDQNYATVKSTSPSVPG